MTKPTVSKVQNRKWCTTDSGRRQR